MTRILLLGGTSEASALARALADQGADAVFSYAGRTAAPVSQPLPTRIGGFGGVAGLVDYLNVNNITHMVDATHPFAAQMSRNAIAACAAAGVALRGFERPAWQAGDGDNWRTARDLDHAVSLLPKAPARVFLAIGKQNLSLFASAAQHHYLLRLVDPVQDLPLPKCTVEIARGPFEVVGDKALLRKHKIDVIVSKNAGGSGARAKLDAARALGIPVIMIDRPELPARQVLHRLDQVLSWLSHTACRGV